MGPDDTIEIIGPSSGGYGDPVERDPQKVVDDVRDGFTSLAQAQEVYCVVIDPESLQLEEEATAELRAEVAGTVKG